MLKCETNLQNILRKQENRATKFASYTNDIGSIQLFILICVTAIALLELVLKVASVELVGLKDPITSSVRNQKVTRRPQLLVNCLQGLQLFPKDRDNKKKNENFDGIPSSPFVTTLQLTTLGSTAARSSRKKIPFERLLS